MQTFPISKNTHNDVIKRGMPRDTKNHSQTGLGILLISSQPVGIGNLIFRGFTGRSIDGFVSVGVSGRTVGTEGNVAIVLKSTDHRFSSIVQALCPSALQKTNLTFNRCHAMSTIFCILYSN